MGRFVLPRKYEGGDSGGRLGFDVDEFLFGLAHGQGFRWRGRYRVRAFYYNDLFSVLVGGPGVPDARRVGQIAKVHRGRGLGGVSRMFFLPQNRPIDPTNFARKQ